MRDVWQIVGSLGTLLAVVAALFIAIFQDKMRLWFHRPKLEVFVHTTPPFCHKTLIAIGDFAAPCYYFRILVKNNGKRRAESVEVLAAELEKLDPNNKYVPYSRFLPMHLLWSHNRRVSESIAPGLFKYCDLGHIIQPEYRNRFPGEDFIISFAEIFFDHDIKTETVLSFDTEVKPLTATHLVPLGKYRLALLLGAANARTVRKSLVINLSGSWHDNEERMLKEGMTVAIE